MVLLRSVHRMEYYLAIKNEALTHATKMTSLRNVMLRSQTQRTTYCVVPHVPWNVQERPIHSDTRTVLAARGWGGRRGSGCC